jgi:predicted dehydrogenase
MRLPRNQVKNRSARRRDRIRYAVVGLGHIAQQAILPAFANAGRNSELVALVSGDSAKLRDLGRQYEVPHLYSYPEFEACLERAEVDAVYIALPNDMHAEYTIRAAQAGVHVLCEKPLAVSAAECRKMIAACNRRRVKLMTAYRLHFDPANLEAIEWVQSGRLGEPRAFNSVFSFQIQPGNIRVRPEKGGGTLYDIGIYCINAARYLFRAEPIEVSAITFQNRDKRFRGVEEMASAILRFPGERLASFTCSFGAADEAQYEVLGTKGLIRLNNAYEYEAPIEVEIVEGGQKKIHSHKKRDQFAPEIIYFSDCILKNQKPEPSGEEGLIDVQIIQALYESARRRAPVRLGRMPRVRYPRPDQQFACPTAKKPKLIHVEAPTRE